MTYQQICNRLLDAGIDSAEWDAALLIEHFCGTDASLVRLDRQRDYPMPELKAAVDRRAARYPLQYLLGEWQFYRQTYEVSADCLIPRSDTERLVEEAIRLLPQNASFVDLCTGSGCIAVSVLAERPDTNAVAVEKFEATLSLATRNAQKNAVRDRFTPQKADILTADFIPVGAPFDAILSNPPYICAKDIAGLSPEVREEPHAALDGGEDGLVFYRSILQNAARYLKSDGFILFEIGFDQAAALCKLGLEHGFTVCRVIKDYGGQDRVVSLAR